jgi:hypothetical protein
MTTGREPGARVAAQALEHLEAMDLRQAQVEQHQPEWLCHRPQQYLDGLGAVACHEHGIGDVVLIQRPQRQLLVVRVVFHQQYRFFVHV